MQGFHNYGSKDWYDKNWQMVQGLGEDLASGQPHDEGLPPAALPANIQVGTAACLANGELYANRLPQDSLVDGFSGVCFVGQHIVDDLGIAAAWNSCGLQFFYATAVQWTYERRAADLDTIFKALLGATCQTFFTAGTDILPDVCIAKSPGVCVVVVDGTVNYQQLAMQAFYGIIPPQDWGVVGTLNLWYSASQWINLAIAAAGVEPAVPVVFAAHSYGAAACAVLAARYRAGNPERNLYYCFFGCPKPGNFRVATRLSGASGIALANDSDLVTIVPFDNAILYPIQSYFPGLRLGVWTEWRRVPNQALQASDGSLTFGAAVTVGFSTAFAMAQDAINGVPFGEILSHGIDIYAARILTRCPQPEWPLTEDLLKLLLGVPVARGGAAAGGGLGVFPPAPAGRGGAAGGGRATENAGPVARGGAEAGGQATESWELGGRGGAEAGGKATETWAPSGRGGAAAGGSGTTSSSPVARGGAAAGGVSG